MYVIIVYDVGEKRVGKMLKLCRQYLCWIQNSVLEGELSEAKLRELQMKMKALLLLLIFIIVHRKMQIFPYCQLESIMVLIQVFIAVCL